MALHDLRPQLNDDGWVPIPEDLSEIFEQLRNRSSGLLVLSSADISGGGMARQSVTLNIEQDLLEEAHAVAVRRHTSVNEMVRQYLKQVVRQERSRLEAWHDVRKLLDRPPVRLGSGLKGPGDRHER